MKLRDEEVRIIAAYLRTNPNLRSLLLDNNSFSDHGFRLLNEALKVNTKLAHLSIRDCDRLTD